MKFFSPLLWYSSTRVDPGYDYDTNTPFYKTRAKRTSSQLCGHEYFTETLADGLLVSRTMLETGSIVVKDKGCYRARARGTWELGDIRDYCRTRKNTLPTFADPGTWTYVHYRKLPDYLLDTEDLIDYYNQLQFDLGGSVDWPIIDRVFEYVEGEPRKSVLLDLKTKEMRRQFTLESAKEFIKRCNRRSELSFMPFGTIQGYSPETYRSSLRELLKMGYEYVAIGGLPSYSEKVVLELLPIFQEEFRRVGHYPGMHLYGRWPTPSKLPQYLRNGVSSFDNNSSAIQAGFSRYPYLHPRYRVEGDAVSSASYGLRMSTSRSPFMGRIRKKDQDLWTNLIEICDESFENFVIFSNKESEASKTKFLQSYRKLHEQFNSSRNKQMSKEKLDEMVDVADQTLTSRLWKLCGCTSCRLLGAHGVLPVGHRYASVFLHNTYIMHDRFLMELKKAKRETEYRQYDWSAVMNLHKIKNKRKAIKGGI